MKSTYGYIVLIIVVVIGIVSIPRLSMAQDSCSLKISLLTCGVGEELYASYGHSALRIQDKCKGTDIVYNYGTFNFGDPDFYSKFTRGKLPYYLNDENFLGFIQTYVQEGRSISEQVLRLNATESKAIQHFLEENLKEENKYYRYDFLFDNCSTRIRDGFSKIFGEKIEWGHIMTNDSVSFRTILNHYERNLHWERFGINLLMSHQVDDKMKSEQAMFLPDYLAKGFDKATLNGNKLVSETKEILVRQKPIEDKLNEPKLYLWLLLGVIFLLSQIKKVKPYLMYVDVLLFLLLGLLGCLMLFMWFGTEHKVCAWNRNLLWAFPFHLVFAALIPTGSEKVKKYAKYASWLLILAVISNLIADQKYMAEIFPLLILIYLRLGYYSKQVKYLSFSK